VVTDTYLTQARAAFLAALAEPEHDWTLTSLEQRLLDLYTLLVLVKGKQCSTEDVHNAWTMALQRERLSNSAPVPFSQLEVSIAALHVPYRDAIRTAAHQLVGVL